jgi:hypothetical protein
MLALLQAIWLEGSKVTYVTKKLLFLWWWRKKGSILTNLLSFSIICTIASKTFWCLQSWRKLHESSWKSILHK